MKCLTRSPFFSRCTTPRRWDPRRGGAPKKESRQPAREAALARPEAGRQRRRGAREGRFFPRPMGRQRYGFCPRLSVLYSACSASDSARWGINWSLRCFAAVPHCREPLQSGAAYPSCQTPSIAGGCLRESERVKASVRAKKRIWVH